MQKHLYRLKKPRKKKKNWLPRNRKKPKSWPSSTNRKISMRIKFDLKKWMDEHVGYHEIFKQRSTDGTHQDSMCTSQLPGARKRAEQSGPGKGEILSQTAIFALSE
jgi:hypothetical protein